MRAHTSPMSQVVAALHEVELGNIHTQELEVRQAVDGVLIGVKAGALRSTQTRPVRHCEFEVQRSMVRPV